MSKTYVKRCYGFTTLYGGGDTFLKNFVTDCIFYSNILIKFHSSFWSLTLRFGKIMTYPTSNKNLQKLFQSTQLKYTYPFLLKHTEQNMEQWPSGWGAGFPIQRSHVQNQWVAPRLTHSLSSFRGRSNEYQEFLGT